MNIEGIVERLNAAKKQKGLTLKQLAEKSGLSLGTVNKIMSGALLDIKADKLNKLALALEVSTEYLLGTSTCDAPAHAQPFYGLVKIACVSPEVRVADCKFNADKIIEKTRQAVNDGAKIVLFPELSITAYTCGDLFFQNTLRKSALEHLLRLSNELKAIDAVIVVGLPIVDNSGILYNAAAVIFHGEILGIIPKSNMPNYNEFYEKRWFAAAPEQNSTITIGNKIVPFGTKIIFQNVLYPQVRFAVEICEDIWVADSPSFKHAEAGANLLLNLSASDETVAKAEYRSKMVEIQSAKACAIYAYCSSGDGESTSDLVFAAHNIIYENGMKLAESKPFGTGYAVAEADFDFIENERAKMSREKVNGNYTIVHYNLPIFEQPTRVYDKSPFVPSDKKVLAERCETVLNLQAHALKKRVSHVHASKLVIGVSGGSDSTLALLVCKRALDLLKRDATDIIAVTMPCFGTTKRTLNNSIALAEALGATVRKIDITASVTQHLADIGCDLNNHDTTYENAQARERTQVLMDIANKENGIVVGTGDMSELALGWCTFNGDQMSMYSVNGGVPKTLVCALIAHVASTSAPSVKQVLQDILETPVSPELLPANSNGEIAQVTENIVGPYKLHDYFLYMIVRKGFSPAKVFELAKLSFKNEFDDKTIYKWLTKFIWRFFSQQFKRSCQPDGIKIGSVDLSKNSWRMPSDACCESWIAELEKLNPDR